MGIPVRKVLDPECAPAHAGKRESQDDSLSRSTATTEEDSPRGLPPSQLSRRWRSGSSSAFPKLSETMCSTSRRTGNPDSQHLKGPYLHRRGYDPPLVPPRQQGTRSVPVKCPPRNTISALGQTLAILSPPDSEDALYLTRLYESRTWKMYRLITEARKGSQYSRTHSMNPPYGGQTKCECENLQHDDDDTESSYGDEMIFPFDFE
jgi:hypothetical protein